MSDDISSIPGANKFRSIVALIIVVACMAFYLVYVEGLEIKADAVARDRVITDIRGSLAMLLYDYSIQGRLHDLNSFDGENPFVILAIYRNLPINYRGTLAEMRQNMEPGWYFDLSMRLAVFVSKDQHIDQYRMVFVFNDRDSDGFFDLRKDGAGQLELKKVF